MRHCLRMPNQKVSKDEFEQMTVNPVVKEALLKVTLGRNLNAQVVQTDANFVVPTVVAVRCSQQYFNGTSVRAYLKHATIRHCQRVSGSLFEFSSKFLDFNLIFIMIITNIYVLFD